MTMESEWVMEQCHALGAVYLCVSGAFSAQYGGGFCHMDGRALARCLPEVWHRQLTADGADARVHTHRAL